MKIQNKYKHNNKRYSIAEIEKTGETLHGIL